MEGRRREGSGRVCRSDEVSERSLMDPAPLNHPMILSV